MPYANLDDSYPGHRKIRALSDSAFRVHTQAIVWCARYGTDGKIKAAEVADIASPVRRWRDAVTTLEQSGLWESIEDGWQLHDYLDWNMSAAQWAAQREKNRQKQARWRAGNQSRNQSPNGLVTSPRPDQTRPEEGAYGRNPSQDPTVPIPEPPLTCPTHIDDPDPPPCGACKAARIAHGKWEQAEAERKRAMPKCRTHPGQYAHNCRACRSEKLGAE